MQSEQGFFSVFLGQTMSVDDWRNGVGHRCVTKYLIELNPMHLLTLYTPFQNLACFFCGRFDAPDAIGRFLYAYAQLGSILTISGEHEPPAWV
jgi:hypothetical protein